MQTHNIYELDIKNKNMLGQGTSHTAFPYYKFDDKIIKTAYGDLQFLKNNPTYVNERPWNKKDLELFQKYPQFCAKVFRIRPNYAVVEKLDTESFLKDSNKLMYCIFDFVKDHPEMASRISPSINIEISNPEDKHSSMIIWMSLDDKELMDKMYDHCGGNFFPKLYKFLKEAYNSGLKQEKKYLDVHDYNLGYDKTGHIKFLDI